MTPLSRITVRRMMLGVAIAGMLLFFLRGFWGLAEDFIDSPYGLGRTTGLLSPGQLVVLSGNYRAAPSGQAIRPTGRTGYKSVMYDWGATPEGNLALTSGTSCVVAIDPAWDEDSCYESRPVAVKLTSGQSQGASVAVPRRLLRKR